MGFFKKKQFSVESIWETLSNTNLTEIWGLRNFGHEKVIQVIGAESPQIILGSDSKSWNLVLQWPDRDESFSISLGTLETPADALMQNIALALNDYLRMPKNNDENLSVSRTLLNQTLALGSLQVLSLKALVNLIEHEQRQDDLDNLGEISDVNSTIAPYILYAKSIIDLIAEQGIETVTGDILIYKSEINWLQSKYDSLVEFMPSQVKKEIENSRWYADELFGENLPKSRFSHFVQFIEQVKIEVQIEEQIPVEKDLHFSLISANSELVVNYFANNEGNWFFQDAVSGGDKPLVGVSNESAMDFCHFIIVHFMIRSIARAKADSGNSWSPASIFNSILKPKNRSFAEYYEPFGIAMLEIYLVRMYWLCSYMLSQSIIRPEMAFPHTLHNEFISQIKTIFPKSSFIAAISADEERLRWLPL